MKATVMMMLMAISPAGASRVIVKDEATLMYDASDVGGFNNYGGCFEADDTYVTDCLFKSNYVGYFLTREPKTATGSCSDFGYDTEVKNDVWDGGKFFWSKKKAGGVSFEEWKEKFYSIHPLLNEKYLKEGNPACNSGKAADREGEVLGPFKGSFLALYDDSPVDDMNMRVCIEGTEPYMLQCAISDPFSYIMMTNAKSTSKSCANVGEEKFDGRMKYVTQDLRAPGFNQSWIDGKQSSGFVGKEYYKAHPLTGHFISYNMGRNPSCLTAFCNTFDLGSPVCNESSPEFKTYNSQIRFPDRSIKPGQPGK